MVGAKAKRASKECTWKNQNSKLMNQQPEGANSTKSYSRKQTNKETNRQKHKVATPRHVFWLSHSHHCFLSLFFPFIITSPTFPSYAFFSFPNVPIHHSFWSPFESKSKLKTVLRFKEGTTFAWLLFTGNSISKLSIKGPWLMKLTLWVSKFDGSPYNIKILMWLKLYNYGHQHQWIYSFILDPTPFWPPTLCKRKTDQLSI